MWISGDTVLYDGVLTVAPRLNVSVAVLHLGEARFPITGPVRYTMTAAQGVELCWTIRPRTVVPVHYEGWSHFRQGRAAIEQALADAPDVRNSFRILPIGTATISPSSVATSGQAKVHLVAAHVGCRPDTDDARRGDPVEVPRRWATTRRRVRGREGIAGDLGGPAVLAVDVGDVLELSAVRDALGLAAEHHVHAVEPRVNVQAGLCARLRPFCVPGPVTTYQAPSIHSEPIAGGVRASVGSDRAQDREDVLPGRGDRVETLSDGAPRHGSIAVLVEVDGARGCCGCHAPTRTEPAESTGLGSVVAQLGWLVSQLLLRGRRWCSPLPGRGRCRSARLLS